MISENGERFIVFRPRRFQIPKKEKERETPWVPPPIQHEDTEEDVQWTAEGVYNQISKTYEKIIEDEIRDDEFAYYIMEFSSSVSHDNSKKVLKKFDGKILLHINPLKSRVLIESPLNILEEIRAKKPLKYIEKNIHLIRPLNINEQFLIDIEDEEWIRKNKEILIQIMPNITDEKRINYIDKILKHIDDLKIERTENPSDPFLKSKGIITAKASVNQCRHILKNTNIVYKIYSSSRIKKGGNLSNIILNKSNFRDEDKKYKICVMDTGLNNIQQLENCIDDISFENTFDDGSDLDTHGTLISCLIVHGEGYNVDNPKYKILSHKIYSDSLEQGNIFNGVINAIEMYKNKTDVFISSCIFEHDNELTKELTARLDNYIQEKKVCVIFCTGNILPIYQRALYPHYIRNNKVQHPSDAISISSVGGLAKKINAVSIGTLKGPSPFTRCGTYTNLNASFKPEVVQHAGNCDDFGNNTDLGVQTFSCEGEEIEDIGTSYASPLFARIIANIYDNYGNEFSFPETAKAIAYSSCDPYQKEYSDFFGFGEPNYNRSVNPSWIDTKLFFEGQIPLAYSEGEQEFDIYDQIRFIAPSRVSDVSLILVHTDDYNRYLEAPRLNTFLSVRTWKPGRESSVNPSYRFPSHNGIRNPGEKCHAKKLTWSYTRGTVGTWTFRFYPMSTIIPTEERNSVVLRYGGVITLKAKSSEIESLTQRFKAANGLS